MKIIQLMIAVVFIITLMLISSLAEASTKIVYDTIALEAGGESLQGQVAVCRTIRNRMRERGLTAEEVVTQRKQYSCWNTYKPGSWQDEHVTPTQFDTAIEAWALSGIESSDPVNMYCRTDCNPWWEDKVSYLYTIGNHKFFYEKRS